LEGREIEASDKWQLGRNHALFDLNQIVVIVKELIQSISNIDPDTRKFCEDLIQMEFT
jgi:hypothetical protein